MNGGRSARLRLIAVFTTLVIATLVVGSVLVRLGRSGQTDDRPEAVDREVEAGEQERAETASGGATPRASRSEDGAAEVAIRYVGAAQEWLYLSDDQVVEAVREAATPQAAERLAAYAVAEIAAARGDLSRTPGRVWWLVHPLAWRAERHDIDSVTVDVWTMTLLSASDVALPQTEWVTVTVELRWLDGDWRVEAVRDTPGPTPMTGPRDRPWEPEPFDDTLGGFTRLDGEPLT